MKIFNTKNYALLAIFLCTSAYPTQKTDENLPPYSAPKYTKMRPPAIEIPEKCDCSEHETTIKTRNYNKNKHSEGEFRHWSIGENIMNDEK